MTTQLQDSPNTAIATAVLTVDARLYIHYQLIALPADFGPHYKINYLGKVYDFHHAFDMYLGDDEDDEPGDNNTINENYMILVFARGKNRIGVKPELQTIHKWRVSGWFLEDEKEQTSKQLLYSITDKM